MVYNVLNRELKGIEWTFSTSQAILEMVVRYKMSKKIVCFKWLLINRAILAKRSDCRKYVSFFKASNGDCKALFVEL